MVLSIYNRIIYNFHQYLPKLRKISKLRFGDGRAARRAQNEILSKNRRLLKFDALKSKRK